MLGSVGGMELDVLQVLEDLQEGRPLLRRVLPAPAYEESERLVRRVCYLRPQLVPVEQVEHVARLLSVERPSLVLELPEDHAEGVNVAVRTVEEVGPLVVLLVWHKQR